MQNIIRSAAGANLQSHQINGKPLSIMANSSLNQKFSVQQNTALADTDNVSQQYITLGNAGHSFIYNGNNVPYPIPVQHEPQHAGLYNHIPFIMRLPNEDLTPTERAKYRLRVIQEYGGKNYVCYYARLLDLSATDPTLELRTVDANGNVTTEPFAYTLADLNPVPPTVTAGSVWTTSGDYIASTGKVPFVLSATDVQEILNAMNIITGDDNTAIISEIGLCSGADRSVTGDFNGVAASYTEVIGCQITFFISAFYALKFLNQGVNAMFDVGSVEPLLQLSQSS